MFVSAGNTERFTTDMQFELEVSAACPNSNRTLLHWCMAGTSQLLSTAEFVHLCEGSVCAVGVCSWQFVWVRFGEAPNNAPFLHTLNVQYIVLVSCQLIFYVCVHNYVSGWSDSNVTTTQTANGSICTSSQPGMYGLLQGDFVCRKERDAFCVTLRVL